MRLQLTRRALDDLALDVDAHAGLPADELTDRHPMIAAFVERRSQSPEGQEAIQLPASRAIVFSLHAGRWRGLTWAEPEIGVVWLLGAGYHRSGDHGDAYAELKRRDEVDALFPTEADYFDLEPDPADYVAAVARDAPSLMQQAREHVGEETAGELGGALNVSVLIEAGDAGDEVWIGFAMPPKTSIPPMPEWLLVALAALLPDADISDVDFAAQFPRRGNRKAEVVIHWRYT
ncbi:MAG: hypothetical protein ACT4OX_15655 [Actinomycetota bacterium]